MSRADEAQHIARAYRDLVQRIAQGRCDDPAGELHRMDMALKRRGIHWHMPNDVPLDDDVWMRAPDLAHALGRCRKDIYNWARLKHIEQRAGPDGVPEYSTASVLAYQRKCSQQQHSRIKN